jgi:hypothetical protein
MRLLTVPLLAILPLLSGCAVVQSVQPLSSPRAAIADQRLAGLWQERDTKGSHCYYYFSFAADGHGTLMMFGTDPKTGLGQIKYDFFVTPAGKGGYLNLSHETEEGMGTSGFFKPRGDNYFFVKYRYLWTGQLDYWPVMGDAFGNAVDSHKLQGRTEYDKQHSSYRNIFLTDSSRHILDFIESSKPNDVLGGPTKLTWIGGP